MSALFISLFVLALVVLFYYVIVLYIQFVLELNVCIFTAYFLVAVANGS